MQKIFSRGFTSKSIFQTSSTPERRNDLLEQANGEDRQALYKQLEQFSSSLMIVGIMPMLIL
jgi:hypothetical protein